MNRSTSTRLLILTLTFALCGAPELIAQSANTAKPLPDAPSATRLIAQNTTAQSPSVAPATSDPQAQPSAPAQQNDPSQPAQEPAPTQNSPRVVPVDPQKATGTDDEQQQQQQQPSADQNTSQEDTTKPVIAPANPAEVQQLENAQKQNEPQAAPVNERVNPLGTAAAEKGRTAGGGASRPAGVAIAPAKQKRSRGLLIKLGALAAAGAAVGTVYALSRGTGSTPAGAVK
jgi:hypothetical protein